MGGDKDQNHNTKSPLPSTGYNEGNKSRITELWLKHMNDYPYKANQSSICRTTDSKNSELRNELKKSIPTILSNKNAKDSRGGTSFYANLWGIPS